MAVFDLENLNQGAWFDYPDGGRIKVRAYSPGLISEIQERHTIRTVEYKRAKKHAQLQAVADEKVNMNAAKDDIHDYVIVTWEGFETPDGTPIECTRETKVNLMNNDPAFYAFVNECVETLVPQLAEDAEDSEKN
jgi:hypothetical protein